jgi:thiol-disulfide isomerase/thioredoxin
MKRLVAVAVVWFVAQLTMGQSLGEVAKKEKERRRKNQATGAQVQTVTEAQVRTRPVDVRATENTSDEGGEADLQQLPDPTGLVEPAPDTARPPATLPPPAMRPAPHFSLQDRAGKTVSLSDLRGRPVLLDFWATWCGPCRATMPEVEKLHRKYRGRGLQVVGINIEGKTDGVLEYLDQNGYSFPIVFDKGNWKSAVAQQYQVSSIPKTFLIDGNGSIVFSGHPNRLSESLIESMLP